MQKWIRKKWGVVACDQYTSQPEYWEDIAQRVGQEPSTLFMILPEVYLGTQRQQIFEEQGPRQMERYLTDGTLVPLDPGMIYVRRTLAQGVRHGLMLALDMDCYDYNPGASSLIRATEKTIVERIPPRIRVRERSPLEVPHVMVLIDDEKDSVLGPLKAKYEALPLAYDTQLLAGGGHLEGRLVRDEISLFEIAHALEGLLAGENPLLFAVGDGNHSLATAKVCWENIKAGLTDEERLEHPARYALVEVVNLHDPALTFEPIHRVIFHTQPEHFMDRLMSELSRQGITAQLVPPAKDCAAVFVEAGKEMGLTLDIPESQLPLTVLQPAMDAIMAGDEIMDFIHGDEVVRELAGEGDCLGILIPALNKSALFPTVLSRGVLPRKSFSMGEAHEKRYYFECRCIR